MAYQLRMSEEFHDWLAGLRGSDPAAATLVTDALIALISVGPNLGSAMVSPLARVRTEGDPAEALDETYQLCLERLQTLRRRVADLATTRKRIEDSIASLAAGRQDQLPALGQDLAGAAAAEEQLTLRSQREQSRVDAFRARKETLKARLATAQAVGMVNTALAGLDNEDPAVSIAAGDSGVQEIEQEIRQEISQVLSATSGTAEAARPYPEPGLMELRPDGRDDGDIRILFAFEPAGAVLVIAVLEGHDAWRDHYDEAVSLSSELLRSARAGDAPEAAARRYDGARPFLDEFFPPRPDVPPR
jgi:hypothetical protein